MNVLDHSQSPCKICVLKIFMLISRKIKLTKKYTFDMAHALYGHDGQCKNIHGRTFHLEVTVEGFPKHTPGAQDDGLMMDFGDLIEKFNKPFDINN
jgi:6-pyruvoyl-tetrahydropterin synthase